MYIEQDEYSAALSDAAGVRLIVHNQTEMPFPEDTGFSITPGHKTSVALSKVDVTQAPPPHGKCVNVDTTQNKQVNGFLGEIPTIGYSDAACYKTCYQIHLMKDCGCFDARYPTGPNITAYAHIANISNMLPCKSASMSAQKEGACEENILKQYVEGKLGCKEICPVECFKTQYSYTISQSEWPSTVKEDAVMEQLMDKSEYLWDLLANETDTWRKMYLRSNALKVDIYFKELDYQQIATSPSYEIGDLLADLGGQAGLWLGVSVIAFFEFIELVYDVISVCVLHKVSPHYPKTEHMISLTP
ncbi:Amiloride-sensitive sodium channel subunit alpha [Lamellibrachia satsuma]|nr:Amiloride-sensitive sodium channel subunit alpha [Lamellibrachia satsuma]